MLFKFTIGMGSIAFIKAYGSIDASMISLVTGYANVIGLTYVLVDRISLRITNTISIVLVVLSLMLYVWFSVTCSYYNLLVANLLIEPLRAVIDNHGWGATINELKNILGDTWNLRHYNNVNRTIGAASGVVGVLVANRLSDIGVDIYSTLAWSIPITCAIDMFKVIGNIRLCNYYQLE